jgi:predicted ATPase with chaperone activity
MIGSPGAGKTKLSQRLPGILPLLSCEQALETSKVFSAAGGCRTISRSWCSGLFALYIMPSPMPDWSAAADIPHSGELSLAHNWALFIDEFPESSHNILDSLRQPFEDGQVTIARASMSQISKTNSCYNFAIILAHAPPLIIKPPNGKKIMTSKPDCVSWETNRINGIPQNAYTAMEFPLQWRATCISKC